jgi:hypothetical protein
MAGVRSGVAKVFNQSTLSKENLCPIKINRNIETDLMTWLKVYFEKYSADCDLESHKVPKNCKACASLLLCSRSKLALVHFVVATYIKD